MDFKLKKPDMVAEAAENGGKNLFLEILMFLGVFLAAETLISIPMVAMELVLLFSNASAMEQIRSGDVQKATETAQAIISSDPMLITQLLATSIMILLPILFCRLVQKRKPRTLGFKKRNMWKEYGIGLLTGFCMMAVIVLIGMAAGSLRLRWNPEALTAGGIAMLILLFAGFLIQGMSEEVMCRGYFLVSVSRKGGNVWLGILVSSLAFGALHLGNLGIAPLAFLNLVLFGIFAGFYFVKRGSIWGIAAIHSMWNFAQGNIFGVLVSGNDFGMTVFVSEINEDMTFLNGGSFGLEGGILTTLVLLAAIMLTARTKQQDAAEDKSEALPCQRQENHCV